MKVFSKTALLSLLLVYGTATAQDLEPRRWSHLPTGVNFVGTRPGGQARSNWCNESEELTGFGGRYSAAAETDPFAAQREKTIGGAS